MNDALEITRHVAFVNHLAFRRVSFAQQGTIVEPSLSELGGLVRFVVVVSHPSWAPSLFGDRRVRNGVLSPTGCAVVLVHDSSVMARSRR